MFRVRDASRLGHFLMSTNHDDLVALKDLIEAGKVTPVMDRTYPLTRDRRSDRPRRRGHARGKVAISVVDVAVTKERPLARVA